MRTLLAFLLALCGAAIWGITAVVTVIGGIALVSDPDSWKEIPVITMLLGLSLIILFIGVGHLMIMFGATMDRNIHYWIPGENQVQWFTCKILRLVAIVLLFPSAIGLALHSLAPSEGSLHAGIATGIATTIIASAIFYLSRILSRFP